MSFFAKFSTRQRRGSVSGSNLNRQRRRSRKVVRPEMVTHNTLQVWRTLPPEIRHDPSMASFQMENDRLGGSSMFSEAEFGDDFESRDEVSNEESGEEGSEFISMRRLRCIDGNGTSSDRRSDDDGGGNGAQRMGGNRNKEAGLTEKRIKKVGLLVFWFFAAVVLITTKEKELVEKIIAIPAEADKAYVLPQRPLGDFRLKLFGAFDEAEKPTNGTDNFVTLQLQVVPAPTEPNGSAAVAAAADAQDILQPWIVPIVAEDDYDSAPIVSTNRTFSMPADVWNALDDQSLVQLKMSVHNASSDFTIKLLYDPLIVNMKMGTILATIILAIFYALLVWEVFHRTFVAIICSMAGISVLALLGDRPTMEEIVIWMEMEMLTLLFAMMLLVSIMTETGVFDYVAVLVFEFSSGNIWSLVYSLCITTCLISCFLDNMTTVLLMTPVAIRFCEVLSLDPVPVLMGIIVHANIGGSLTPIGDPISIIICSNSYIAESDITFLKFVAHTMPGVVLTVVLSCVYLHLVFRDVNSLRLNEPKECKELRREIKLWERTAYALPSFSKDADVVRETLLQKVKYLKRRLRKKESAVGSNAVYVNTLEDLKLKYPIKNKVLLAQSMVALAFVLTCFFIQSVPHLRTLPLGWVALLGIIGLFIVLNREDTDHMMHRVEWTTLLFFAAMFVMMECVERLGLFASIGELTESIILSVDKQHRLTMAIFIILWISALASAILDSIPVAAMMVKVVISVVTKQSLDLPLEPLVWAVVFGPCLGGNGTLYGASANVISAGMAEQHGYKISFTRYLKIVFPMMLCQVAIITAYLMVAHIFFEWH